MGGAHRGKRGGDWKWPRPFPERELGGMGWGGGGLMGTAMGLALGRAWAEGGMCCGCGAGYGAGWGCRTGSGAVD